MILVEVLIVLLAVGAGITNRSVLVGALPIIWLLWSMLCLWLAKQ